MLDAYEKQIAEYLRMGLNLAAIRKIINNQLENPVSYNAYKYYVNSEEELCKLWVGQKITHSPTISLKSA